MHKLALLYFVRQRGPAILLSVSFAMAAVACHLIVRVRSGLVAHVFALAFACPLSLTFALALLQTAQPFMGTEPDKVS